MVCNLDISVYSNICSLGIAITVLIPLEDLLGNFYVREGSKSLSNWTFSRRPISLEQQILVLKELDVAIMVNLKCQNTEVPRNRLTLRDGTRA